MSHIYDLLTRHPANPLLTTLHWPYPAHTVFNPAATRLKDGRTLLLARVEDRRGFSHLTKAVSENGVDGWVVDDRPTFPPRPDTHPEEKWGVEDARITFLPELDQYAIAYTSFSGDGPGVSLALTRDFETFRRCGRAMLPDDKDAALFPRTIGGKFAMIHRPVPRNGGYANMAISFCSDPDLAAWGQTKTLLTARSGGWWDARKIGLCNPPVETPEGWLIFYHGVRTNIAGGLYRVGVSLHDLDDPTQVIRRGSEWIFGPHTFYEMAGDVGMVVFPCGHVVEDDGDTIRLYYGAADTSVALATGSIRGILNWLETHDSNDEADFSAMWRSDDAALARMIGG